jgi:hypothetical protein
MTGKDWEEWADLLREAHHEPIEPAYYAAVRTRVLAELGRERRPAWQRTWVWGLASIVLVVAFVIVPRPAPVGQAVPPALRTKAPAPIYQPATPAPTVAANPRPAARHRRRILARVNQGGRPGGPPHLEPVVIKLLTDDPNVIIYWIADAKGE